MKATEANQGHSRTVVKPKVLIKSKVGQTLPLPHLCFMFLICSYFHKSISTLSSPQLLCCTLLAMLFSPRYVLSTHGIYTVCYSPYTLAPMLQLFSLSFQFLTLLLYCTSYFIQPHFQPLALLQCMSPFSLLYSHLIRDIN